MAGQIARRYFTVDEFHRMGEAGIFSEDDRVELMEGEIVMMSPIGSRHAASVNRLHTELTTSLQGRAIVSVQNPIVLNDFSEPEPDIALLKPRADFYSPALPTASDVLLVVEVADSSIDYDRDIKLPAYARSGISEVWLVDIISEHLTVYSDPVGGVFRNTRPCQKSDAVSPLHFPDLSIRVASILG